jgi:hypothetical protein
MQTDDLRLKAGDDVTPDAAAAAATAAAAAAYEFKTNSK